MKLPPQTSQPRYKLTGETKTAYGHIVHRVLWLADNREGGWIEAEESLPQDGTAVLHGDALVFRGALLTGGVFRGGMFRGGVFRGGVFYQSPATAQRTDGYTFIAKYVNDELRVWAGCRNFSWAEAKAHWNANHPRGKESRRIIKFLKAQAKDERNAT